MTRQDPMMHRGLEFDVVLDAWPDHVQGQALHSLITSGDVIAVQLPYGFVGLITVSSPMLMHRDEGQLRIRQILPTPRGRLRQYQRTGTRSYR